MFPFSASVSMRASRIAAPCAYTRRFALAQRIPAPASFLRTVLSAVASFLIILAAPAHATVYYVNGASTAANPDGATWETAFASLQDACDIAYYDDDEIWVAKGTYVGPFLVWSIYSLYGGFAGTETAREQRDPMANLTVLDGNQAGSVVRFINVGDTYYESVLEGFTIQNGKAVYGGGVMCFNRSPSITNNVIRNNTANVGGGVYGATSRSYITNNVITGNTADLGGGVAAAEFSTLTVQSNAITGNTASSGAGIWCHTSETSISGNTVTGNVGLSGGGGIQCEASDTPIQGNWISANAAPAGAGIACIGGAPLIEGNYIADNSAHAYFGGPATTDFGGGIYCASSSPAILRNWIYGNRGDYGGGIGCFAGSNPFVANNTIAGNGASEGGGLYADASSPVFRNNTVFGNTAITLGGAVCAYNNSTPTLVNNILAHNSSGVYSDDASIVMRANCLFANAAYQCEGFPDPTGRDRNITADPRLSSVAYGYPEIAPDSPCRNAGDDATVPDGETDQIGAPRIQSGRVDIGAFESNGTVAEVMPLVVRVAPDGDDANDGSSWEKPKATLQAAVDAASAIGGEVWVRGGTYNQRAVLRSFTYLYGGFAGMETERGQRNIAANPTVLDAHEQGLLVQALSGYRVSTLDGFTLRNGRGFRFWEDDSAGAVYVMEGGPMIRNNTFEDNRAGQGEGWGIGGALYGTGPLLLTHNTFRRNWSGAGAGAAFVWAGSEVMDNVFEVNESWQGGGLWISGSGRALVARNTFTGNTGYYGGAIRASSGLAMDLRDNVFRTNTSPSGRGGVDVTLRANGNIINNTFVGNEGAITVRNSSRAFLANNIFAHNSVYVEGDGSTATLSHNDFYASGISGGQIGPTDRTDAPLFVDEAAGDFRLQAGSPLIDAGADDYLLPDETDRAGSPRRQGAHVDMGAFEWSATPGFTMDDVRLALSIAAGTSGCDAATAARLNVEDAGASQGCTDLADAIRIARKVSGME